MASEHSWRWRVVVVGVLTTVHVATILEENDCKSILIRLRCREEAWTEIAHGACLVKMK